MINSFIKKLINELKIKKCIEIDLILDGGMFNGSYQIGVLLYLKELEKQKLIKVKRISGASIGTFVGLLFLIDKLDLGIKLYKEIYNEFKYENSLTIIKKLNSRLKKFIPKKLSFLNEKFFVTYNDIISQDKIVKSTFKNKYDLFESIVKSCFVPYLIDGNLLYKQKFMDGMNPYFFNNKRKSLFIDLLGPNIIKNAIIVKNEQSNIPRIIYGIQDIHNFIQSGKNTNLCYYIDDKNIRQKIYFKIRFFCEKIITIYTLFLFILKKKIIPHNICFCNSIFKQIKSALILFKNYYLI
jgi:hypothetical protein